MTAQDTEPGTGSQQADIDTARAGLQQWAYQVIALRRQVADAFPPAGAPAGRVYEALVTTRAALDQTEEILRNAVGYRGGVRRWAQDAEFEEADEFDRRSAAQRRSGREAGNYTTGREREADIRLQMLPQVRENRARTRLRDECEELLEAIRIAHRGIDGARQDLVAVLRYLQFESHLER